MNREAQRGAASRAMPKGVGAKGRRTLIKGGTILSMDERVGDHATGDVLIDYDRGGRALHLGARRGCC
jgi:hypothetical protein